MLVETETAPLPDGSAIEALVAALQAGSATATQVADQLLSLSAGEAHPRIKAALLERAAHLVREQDRGRAANLLRESFRLFPTQSVGKTLLATVEGEPVYRRLRRLGNLVDAIAALASPGLARVQALVEAARNHVGQGHGRAAQAVLHEALALDPHAESARELLEVAEQQVTDRQEALTERRMELAECDDAGRAQALISYAELLLDGDEPLGDAAAVLADAVDSGAPVELAAPLWVEVARAMGDRGELTRALACSLTAGEALPTRLQHADELANIPSVDRESPQAAALALGALAEALPDDATLIARLEVVGALLSDEPAAETEALRTRAVRDRDRNLETTASLALAWLAHRADDWTTAERHYRRVRTLAPQDTEALDFFEGYYRKTGDHKRLLVALSQRLGASEGRETVSIALEMAHLCEGPLATPERAIEAYQRVLTVQPDHVEAMSALQRLNDELHRWPALRDILERQARAYIAKSEIDPTVKDLALAALGRLAELLNDPHKLGDAEQALAVHRRILHLDPRQAEAVAAVVKHAATAGRWDQVVAAQRTAGQACSDAHQAANYFGQAAEVAASQLQNPALAVELWRQALAALPGDREIAKKLRVVALVVGDTAGALESLLGELVAELGAATLDPTAALPDKVAAELVGTLEEASRLTDHQADRGELATRLYALLALAEPGHLAALTVLVDRWRDSRPTELIALLQRQLQSDPTRERQVQILEHLAQVYLQPVGDAAGAEKAAAQLLTLDPTNATARTVQMRGAAQRLDFSGLRGLCGADRAGAERFAEVCLEAASDRRDEGRFALWQTAATTLAGELGDAERAALLLSDAVQQASEGEVATALRIDLARSLLQVAGAAGLLGAERLAVESLLGWVDEREQSPLRLKLAELAQAAGQWSDSLDLLSAVAEDELTASRGAGFALATERMLQVIAELDDADLVLVHLQRLVDLAELAQSDAGSRDGLGASLPQLWTHLATMLTQRDDAWELVLRATAAGLESGANAELLDLRERAASELGLWDDATAALTQLAELQQGEDRAATLLRAASLADSAGGDAVRSEALYRQALELAPTNREAWAGLVATVRQGGDKHALAVALEQMLGLETLGRETRLRAVSERVELAVLHGEASPLQTAWALLQALPQQTSLSDSERHLLGLATGQLAGADKVEVARRVGPALQQHGGDDDRLLCQEILAFAEPDGSPARQQALLALAQVLASRDAERSWTSLQAAVVQTPTDATIAQARAIAQISGSDSQLLALLCVLAGQSESDEVAAAEPTLAPVLLRHAIEMAEASDDADMAQALCYAWRAIAPEASEPLAILARLSAASGDKEALLDVLRAQCSLGHDDDKLSAWLQVADLQDDSEARAAVLAQAVAALPTQPDLWLAWLSVLRDSSDFAGLADALGQALAAEGVDLGEKASLQRERAVALGTQGRDQLIAAAATWLDLLDADPADDDAAEQALAGVLSAVHEWAGQRDTDLLSLVERCEPLIDARGEALGVAALLEARTKLHIATDADRKAWQRLAEFRENSLGEQSAAFAAAAEALRLQPSDAVWAATCKRLAGQALAAGESADAIANAFEHAANAAETSELRLDLRRAALASDGLTVPVLRTLLEAILADAPTDDAAMAQLGALAEREGDAQTRLSLFGLRIRNAGDPEAAAALWLEKAEILFDLGETQEAEAAYQTAAATGAGEVRLAARAALVGLAEMANDPLTLALAIDELRAETSDAEGQVALRLRAAQVFAEADMGSDAQEQLRHGLAEQPASAELHQALEDLLRDADDAAGLAALLAGAWNRLTGLDSAELDGLAARYLAAVADAHGLGVALVDAVELVQIDGRNPANLNDILEAASQDDAAATRALGLLIALRRAVGDVEGEVAARLQRLQQPDASVDADSERRTVAALLRDKLGEPEAALGQYQQLLGGATWLDSDAQVALELADQVDQAADVEDLLALALTDLGDAQRQRNLLTLLAERALGRADLQRALQALAALTDVADSQAAIVRLSQALLEHDAELGDDQREVVLRQVVAHHPDSQERAVAALELAALLANQAGRVGEAIEFAQIAGQETELAGPAFELLGLHAPDAPARKVLAEQAAATYPPAAEWLEDQARLSGHGDELVTLLQVRAERATVDDPQAAGEMWLQVARTAAEFGQDATARAAADQALKLDARHPAGLALATHLAEKAGDLAMVAALAERHAELVSGAEAASLWLKRAAALDQLADLAGAVDACELALLADDSYLAAYRLRSGLLQREGRASEALTVLQADAARAQGELAATLWLDAAALARQAGDAAGWGAALAKAIDGQASADGLASELDRAGDGPEWAAAAGKDVAAALTRQGRQAEALQLAFAALDLAGDLLAGLEQAQLVASEAGALEDWLERATELIGSGQVSDEQLLPVVALVASAAADLGLLDRGAELWELAWEQRPDDPDARDAVLGLRRGAGDPHLLAASLERALVFAEGTERRQFRMELAELRLRALGKPRESLRLVGEVLQAEPGNASAMALARALAENPVAAEEALRLLGALAQRSGDDEARAWVLQRRLPRAARSEERSAIAQELASLQARGVGGGGGTLQSLLAAIQASPSPALLTTMEALAREVDDDEVMSAAYAAVLALPLPVAEACPLLLRAATLEVRRNHAELAEPLLQRAVNDAPDFDDAAELLQALLEGQGRRTELLRLYQRRVELLQDPEVRRLTLYKLADLAHELGHSDLAVAAWRDLVQLDPSDRASAQAWVDLLRHDPPAGDLAEALVSLARTHDAGHAKAELLSEAARLRMRAGYPEHEVEDLYQQAFAADPSLDEAFVWFERHLAQQPRQMATLLSQRCEHLPAGPARVRALRKLAQLRRDLGEMPQACAALERAVHDDPNNTAVLDELLRTAEQGRVWPAWMVGAAQRLAGEARKEAKITLLAQMARVALAELGDVERAQQAATELEQLAPRDPNLRQIKALLLAHTGSAADAAAGIEAAVKETDDPLQLLVLHVQLADLYLNKLDNPARGVRELQRILTLDPKRTEARRRLCDLYRSRNSFEALAESLKQWLALVDDNMGRATLHIGRGREMVDLLRELGETQLLINQPTEAAQSLERAWDLCGDDPELADQLAPTLAQAGAVELAERLYDFLADHYRADKPKQTNYLAQSALLRERRGDLHGARDRFKRALEAAPANDVATLGSARVCLGLGEIDRAMRLFDAVARHSGADHTPATRADAHVGMGHCRLARNQLDQARACFEEALAIQPGHKAATDALARL